MKYLKIFEEWDYYDKKAIIEFGVKTSIVLKFHRIFPGRSILLPI